MLDATMNSSAWIKNIICYCGSQPLLLKGANETWSHYFASPGWADELRLQGELAECFQIRADDAAAAALAALCLHWGNPEDAVIAAVHYGGDTDTVAAITSTIPQ